jgi:hypothetical protein
MQKLIEDVKRLLEEADPTISVIELNGRDGLYKEDTSAEAPLLPEDYPTDA